MPDSRDDTAHKSNGPAAQSRFALPCVPQHWNPTFANLPAVSAEWIKACQPNDCKRYTEAAIDVERD